MDREWSPGKKSVYVLWRAALLLCAGACMGYLALRYAYGQYHWGVFEGYKSSGMLMALNILPAMWLVGIFYALTGRAWLAFLLGGSSTLGLSAGHFYKLCFRDDPLYFEDLLILREAGAMATEQNYTPFADARVILALLGAIAGTAALAVLCRGVMRGWKRRLALALALAAAAGAALPVYLDESRYAAVENYEHLNRWSPTQNYISHGFFYPFIHSVNEFVETAPEGYSQRKAEALLRAYEDADIPEEKKVSVIAVMREAYVDLSDFDIPGLDTSGYQAYHRLQEESYSGSLLTNIFAGGTIDSERCFLTGNYQLKNFRSAANSYLWYLRDQGYTVEGSHPYYQWFYNRQNVNTYLGFEDYRFTENYYGALVHPTSAIWNSDHILAEELLTQLKERSADGPCFSFSVAYQNHGPYESAYTAGEAYLTSAATGLQEETCHIWNNYLSGVSETIDAMVTLTEGLEESGEPVVLVLFGDHKPWGGNGNLAYTELGVTFDISTTQGFYDYYATPYLIWANSAAKAALGREFVGDGGDFSPCFLMPALFDACGWEGPGFMALARDVRAITPLVHERGLYWQDGLTAQLPKEESAFLQNFLCAQYCRETEIIPNK